MPNKNFLAASCLTWFLMLVPLAQAGLDLDRLSPEDIQTVEGLIQKLAPVITERDKQGTLAELTFDDLYAPLNRKDRKYLKEYLNLDPKKVGVKIPYRGIAKGDVKLVKISGQKMNVKGDVKELVPQFLPVKVHQKYTAMMKAMKKDIGKVLYVESGYRSSAYQLYIFLFYLKNHEYSIRETARFVALPGYSEHGSPEHQAIDFINENGINGEYNPKEFEGLPEYRWLLKNARKYGFELSYPRKSREEITFEPWHWRYRGGK
ncbi:MAG: M15 family metallopeptidase [Candidatus Omnitrophica bacterium]|nr:M15 family metallopeptidase [Candidatus Omnitrophota bacterium]MDD5670877.1 M15 family metallopeptidase [Candidatus Omnitrophota bacterium]